VSPRDLPPIALGAAALICGATLAAVAPPAPHDPRIALTLAASLCLGLVCLRDTSARHARLLAGVAWLTLGWSAAALRAGADASDCRRGIEDGARLRFEGVLSSAPLSDGGAFLELESIAVAGGPMAPCAGEVRVRLRAGGQALYAGAPLRGSGRWWRSDLDPSRLPAARAGTLLVDRVDGVGATTSRHPLLALRGGAQRRIRELFGERAGVVEALLLARKEGLEPEQRESFAAAGIAHLLAISGFHVGLIAAALLAAALAAGLPPATAGIVACAASGAYVLFIGAPASAVRAVLMLALFLAARLSGRPANPYAVLGAAALGLWLVDPSVAADIGFQLSFAGVAGLFALAGPAERLLPERLPRSLRSGLGASVAATVATAPFTALHFQQIAPAGLLANLIAVPLAAAAVPAAIASLALGTVWLPLGAFLAGGAGLLLDGLSWTARVFAALPGGSIQVTRASALAMALALLFGWLIARRLPARLGSGRHAGGGTRPWVRRAVGAAAALVVLLAWPLFGTGGSRLELHVIDVGQGDAIAVRTPAGRWLLIDAGPAANTFDAGERRVVPYLLRQGTRRLHALILTHPDADHIGGAAAVLERLRPERVFDPGAAWGKPLHAELLLASRGRTDWYAARTGRTLSLDGVTLEFLHPDARFLDGAPEANDASVVVRLRYAEHVALLMGDAHAAVERALAEREGERLRATILKVGHHGSRTSTSSDLLAAAQPALALISAGRRNRFGHPHGVVVDRLERSGARILRTDRDGDIVVTLRPGRPPATRIARTGTQGIQPREERTADSPDRAAARPTRRDADRRPRAADRRRRAAGRRGRSPRPRGHPARPLAARAGWPPVGHGPARGGRHHRRHHRRASGHAAGRAAAAPRAGARAAMGTSALYLPAALRPGPPAPRLPRQPVRARGPRGRARLRSPTERAMAAAVVTLDRHIIEQERLHPEATGQFTGILYDLALAAKMISRAVNQAGLIDILGATERVNVHGEEVKKLDEYADEIIFKALDHTGYLCCMASEESEDPKEIPAHFPTGKYALLYDPLDGSSNIDANVSIGTIFSIHRKISDADRGSMEDLLQPGHRQVGAGYIVYGSSTMLVYTTGAGVHGFTLDPSIGEFLLSHPDMRIPDPPRKIYSANEAYFTRWHDGQQRLIERLKGTDGDPSGGGYTSRYVGSLVADFHRTLLYGGIFMYPKDRKSPDGKLRLLYEAAPLAFVAEQAGGRASDGTRSIMDVDPRELHQRTPLYIGSRELVDMAEEFVRND